jgi:hypothetical protein
LLAPLASAAPRAGLGSSLRDWTLPFLSAGLLYRRDGTAACACYIGANCSFMVSFVRLEREMCELLWGTDSRAGKRVKYER